MTEEAFIRAVVAAPGQDTPRLVYADWLDDHGESARAAYLRAESEWAVPGRAGGRPADPPERRTTAAGFDALWVARVSRPPLGVYCDHFVMEDVGPELSRADLARVEAEFGFQFPVEYAAFLLNHNGGRPYPSTAWLPKSAMFSIEYVHRFYPIAIGDHRPPGCLQTRIDRFNRDVLPRLLSRVEIAVEVVAAWYAGRIPVAETPDPGCEDLLAVSGDECGTITWTDWSSDPMDPPRRGPEFRTYLAEFRPPAEFVIPDIAWDDSEPTDYQPPPMADETEIPF